jgi:probable addiction module antidote protein
MRPKLNAVDYRNQPEMIAGYINDAIETGDSAKIAQAIGDMARIHGMSELSRECGMARSALYRSFGGEIMPKLDTVVKSLAVLGLELQVKPLSV